MRPLQAIGRRLSVRRCRKEKGRRPKSALVVSPTHAEAARITQAIRDGLKAKGKLGDERIVKGWIATHLTDAQKADATEYEPGDLLQFHQNAPGFKKGSRLIVGEGASRRRSLPSGSRCTGRHSSPWP